MKLFVTGASGMIGSALVADLLEHGHHPVGLARSDESAAALQAAGAQVLRGSTDDLEVLQRGAADSDGVVHLAYNHDFTDMAAAAEEDRRAIETFGRVLAGSDRPLAIASGTLGVRPGRVVTENDRPGPDDSGRQGAAWATVQLAEQGVRSIVVRLSPTVHGPTDHHGFVPRLIATAREKNKSGYPGDGTSRWSAVHVLDAASLFRLGVEKAPAGSILHGVGDEALTSREIASAIGGRLGVPAVSIPDGEVEPHFGWLGALFAMDCPASNVITRDLVGWTPTHPGLIADLGEDHYFTNAN